MEKIQPLHYLGRPDKWYLGGGNRLLWAPPFPVWLDYPGFWDKAHYFNREIEPVFTWTILDESGTEISLKAIERRWMPSNLTTRFEMRDFRETHKFSVNEGIKITVQEDKCCLPEDVLVSQFSIKNRQSKRVRLHIIAWTIQPTYPSKNTTRLENIKQNDNRISFTKYLSAPHVAGSALPVQCMLRMEGKVASYSINLSEGSAIQPLWKLTPFVEKFNNGLLPNEQKITGVSEDGLLYMGLHKTIEIGKNAEEHITIFFSAGPMKSLSKKISVNLSNPIVKSEKNWNEHFLSVPYFECSDEYLTRYYWYRWYGLKLNTIDVQEKNYRHPFVCEGIGYFRAPISYSAMCHMLENRWMATPELARGSLLTFIENQRDDGSYRGYIDMDFQREEQIGKNIVEPFYHANWGNSLIGLHRIHPDNNFLKVAYESLVRYANYFDRERDKERSGMYDIDNHYETGQEYMHRYLAVNPEADKDNWGEVFRLKGVDVTVYMYELKKSLSTIARVLNDRKAEELWRTGAENIKCSIIENMWDKREKMFFDVNPKTGKRIRIKSAICFYPYMTDIVSGLHIAGLKRHLFSPKEFWTKYPVPSSSVDDEYFHTDAEWKGKRMNCPWNGRVWPMTNSHIAEAIAQTAIRFSDIELKQKGVEFISKFIKMMFYEENPKFPNCVEHYNPDTGYPSTYRGIDDYQHSWVNDLIIKYVVGLRVYDNYIIIEPFPLNVHYVHFNSYNIRGNSIRIERTGKNVVVQLNNEKMKSTTSGEPIVLTV